jgi:alkanesulfonate monooxygenase SsuD/methylene tetrahydromethanopterin reductase-like flavin-dependent oxidoreductase (luciferase family)
LEDDGGYGQESPEQYPGQISNALADQRASKKRAQDDVKLLANRIALLKLEEKKAWKKIEETKKKATDIMVVRQRNNENKNFKSQLEE